MGLFLLAGAAGLPAAVEAPEALAAPIQPTYTLTLTGYNAVPAQTDSSPFETASGAYSNPEVVAARSQDLGDELPFGTIVAIDGPRSATNGGCNYETVKSGIGYRVIADTMNVRFKNRIDVLFPVKDRYLLPSGGTMNAASLLGACPGTAVRVVGFVNIANPAKLPKTQAELAALVENHLAVR
jgi:3D (Asp-Asp-Asp) domain-containing protein